MRKRKEQSEGTLWTAAFVISAVILVLIFAATIFAPVLAPADPDALDLKHVFASPSLEHLLGTDKTGRDIFSRILFEEG